MIRLFRALLRSDDGATLVEYALVVALVAIVAILAVTKLGASTAANLNKAAVSI
jgi:pilus assembly protein Flp/PilA